MKLLLQITVILIFTTQIYSQNAILNVHLNDGTVSSFTLTEIDSITFTVDGDGGGGMGESCPATVTYSGKTYNTVQIGNQCWLKENLDVGTMIISGYNHTLQQQTNNGVLEKYCYDNDPANCDKYGGLYEWPEAMKYTTVEGTRGICPPGWHIPTTTEFEILRINVNSNGNALKSIGEGFGSGAGTNETGFSALFAGYRYVTDGHFDRLGHSTYFWSSTEYNSSNANSMYLLNDRSNVNFYDFHKNSGFSVRCLKD